MRDLLLVGAGHTHLYLVKHARDLLDVGYRVHLLAPRHFDYSGVASAWAAGVLDQHAGRIDVAALAGASGVRFHRGTLVGLDARARVAVTSDGARLAYDVLSLNVGSVVSPADVVVHPSVVRVKPLTGLAELDARIRGARPPGATVTVVGGGASGLELAAHLSARADVTHVHLLHAGPVLGPGLPAGARRRVARLLASRGVTVRTGCVARRIDERVTICGDGTTVRHDVALLAAGLVAPPLLAELGLGDARGVPVRATLQHVDRDDVYAVGDCADFLPGALSRIGVHGVRQGPVLLHSLLARVRGEPLPLYEPRRRALSILDLGDGVGLAVLGRWWWSGSGALRVKRHIDRRWLSDYAGRTARPQDREPRDIRGRRFGGRAVSGRAGGRRTDPTVSIIVPVLDEGAVVAPALARLRRDFGDCELLVVDGGSSDATVGLASEHARVLSTGPGRARQMNEGARHASGDVLWFVHADTTIDPDALHQLRDALADPATVGGGLSLRFDRRSPSLDYLARVSTVRARRLHHVFGDQAMFVRRDVFDRLGGFAALPLMEDLEFSRRLHRAGRLVVLPATSTASARRFTRHGTVRMIIFMQYLKVLFLAGVSPERIRLRYEAGPGVVLPGGRRSNRRRRAPRRPTVPPRDATPNDTGAADAPELAALLPALAAAVGAVEPAWTSRQLAPLPDRGLAHHHVSLTGTGVLARIPKQSQLQLAPEANLAYQAACFRRAGVSGHAPSLHGVIAPSGGLPRGALLVDRIVGRAARLPEDLPAIARALAGIHSLPLPPREQRPPLWDDADPLEALAREIGVQATYLDEARIDASALRSIRSQFDLLADAVRRDDRPQRRLISFDAHPGNFVVRPDGSAVLVDLEKCRYSYPALDLAHATLYTSTTWEPGIDVTLSPAQVADTYRSWADAFDGDPDESWQLPLRRAMWLWSVTWCAKWRVLSDREPDRGVEGEDWSTARSASTVTDHVRGRVDDYLDAAVIGRLIDEFDAW